MSEGGFVGGGIGGGQGYGLAIAHKQIAHEGFPADAGGVGDSVLRAVHRLRLDDVDEDPRPFDVAQELVAPSQRVITVHDQRKILKADVRAYAYAGQVQLFTARLYDGQTTNFRTAGGGFAPVLTPPADGAATEAPACHCEATSLGGGA